jgi:hypothetical protein
MDELTRQALNEIPEPVTGQVESPTAETNDMEVQVDETPASESETEETIEQPSEEVVQPPKKGAESRIRELNTKLKEERAERESLAERIKELTGTLDNSGYQPSNGYNPNNPIVAPGEEVTAEELQARISQRDQWLLQQSRNETSFMLQREKVINRIQNESHEVEKNYPQLNPDSDNYDKELAESISQAGLAYVRVNPTGSLSKFVDGLMKPYMRSVEKSVSSQQTEIAKQASQTAMRPNQVPANTEKNVAEMDIKELEKKLGIIY